MHGHYIYISIHSFIHHLFSICPSFYPLFGSQYDSSSGHKSWEWIPLVSLSIHSSTHLWRINVNIWCECDPIIPGKYLVCVQCVNWRSILSFNQYRLRIGSGFLNLLTYSVMIYLNSGNCVLYYDLHGRGKMTHLMKDCTK